MPERRDQLVDVLGSGTQPQAGPFRAFAVAEAVQQGVGTEPAVANTDRMFGRQML
jgi:hypothetical protein